MLAKLDAWIKWINRLAYLCGAVAVALMMIQTTAHALSQYIFSYPLPGTIFSYRIIIWSSSHSCALEQFN